MKIGKWIIALLLISSLSVRAQEISEQDTINTVSLEQVVVSGSRQGTVLLSNSILKTETITRTGLQKMACCNLSESFENSASATVSFSDAISGAKQIQPLGLAGIYSQTLAENVPTMRGLASTYGLSYIPASWLESIQIAKGASSVINGYESISGQMNLEFKKPNNTEPLFINLYADAQQHYEANLTSAVQLSEKLWTGLLLSGLRGAGVHDENGDGFLDMPMIKYVNAYNRWFYLNDEKGIQSRTGIKFLYEDRKAGQDSLCHLKHNLPLDGIELFETFITNRNFTAYNKTGISVGDKAGQSLGLINSFTRHEQNSTFGRKTFNGVQNSYYLNISFSSFINNTNHRYVAGASFGYDNYATEYEDEYIARFASQIRTPSTLLDRTESVSGVFAEYTDTHISKLTLVAGLRMDYNSRFGWLVTPRMNVKYDADEWITLRVSAGRGFRSPHVIAENTGLMASSRAFDISTVHDLDIERAWNFGGNIAFTIPIWDGRYAKLSLDYFHTNFQNQIIIDTERNRNAVFFYNSNGTTNYANMWQIDLSTVLFRGFELFTAFRYNNNRITYTDRTQQMETNKPLFPSYKGLVNLSYATPLRRWVFDVTAQLNGRTRLPGMNGYHSEKIYSPSFPVYFAQVTRNNKRLDIYAGAENILGYKQKEPIREWAAPFSSDFDASMIWGPISGIKIYAGIRLRIGKLY